MVEKTLAEQFRDSAIQWKVQNAVNEKADAEAKINTLGQAVTDVINQYGALYIQVPNSGDSAPIYRAIQTRYGSKYLESLGFRIETMAGLVNIWWGDPVDVEHQVDLILNPPPPEPQEPASSERPTVPEEPATNPSAPGV